MLENNNSYGTFIQFIDNMRNIYTAVWPFYFVTKSLGLFPMSFDGTPEKGRFVVKWHDFIAPVSMVLLAICVFILPIVILYPESVNSFSPWMIIVMQLISLSGTALNFIPFFHQISRRKFVVKFVHSLHSFDEKVSSDLFSKSNGYQHFVHRRSFCDCQSTTRDTESFPPRFQFCA